MNITGILKSIKNMKEDESINLSVRKSKNVHGIEVKELSCAKQIEALKALSQVPKTIITDVFGDVSDENILEKYNNVNAQNMLELGLKILAIAPEYIFSVLSKLLDVEVSTLKEMPLKSILEIIQALIELNDYKEVFTMARDIMNKLQAKETNTGYKIF